VTVSRLSRLIDEQVRFGILGLAEERTWDRESRSWLPTYVYITPVEFQMLGVDMDKLFKEQEKKLRQSAEREQLIREGGMNEYDDVQPHSARKCWSARKRREAMVYRHKKGAERKRANNILYCGSEKKDIRPCFINGAVCAVFSGLLHKSDKFHYGYLNSDNIPDELPTSDVNTPPLARPVALQILKRFLREYSLKT